MQLRHQVNTRLTLGLAGYAALLLLAAPSHAQTLAQTNEGQVESTTLQTTSQTTRTEIPCECELELKLLTPDDKDVLDVPAAVVVLRYDADRTVELRVNDKLIDRNLIGKTEVDAKGIRTETFYGVPLQSGSNILSAKTIENGQVKEERTAIVKVRGQAKAVTVSTVETRIPADGRSTMTIVGQVLDDGGQLSNRDTLVTLSTNAGEFVGEDADRLQPGFQVMAKQGRYSAKLQSGTRAQAIQVRAAIGGANSTLEAYAQAQFETSLRPSIATGVIDLRIGGKGNDFYGKLRNFLPLDGDNPTTVDLKGQLFASGAVGDWLMTSAYNSDRTINAACDGSNRLFGKNQPCDLDYATYGDGSKQEILAPSTDSLFLKFERRSPNTIGGTDRFLWGDYRTDDFARRSQQFTAITRELHGFSGNYNIGNLQLSGFFGNNVEGFQRDTIAPDGTSGTYLLSNRNLIVGSESVFVELEELNRPGTVIERRPLTRGADYAIDYDRGSILFSQPVLRTDIGNEGETLVRRIVATYQHEAGGSSNIYGGRLQYNARRDRGSESWLAGTYIREDKGSRDYQLYGVDALVSLGNNSTLIAEFAHSQNDSEILGKVDGSAYRVEVNGQISPDVSARAYLRHADTGFSNNATVSFAPGQTRYGAEVAAKVAPKTRVRLQYDHERNEGNAPQPRLNFGDLFAANEEATPGVAVDNQLTTITAGLQQTIGKADLNLDWVYRDRQDNLGNALDETSHQLRSRLSVPLTDRLSFLAQNETTLSADVDPVYNDRTLLGLNWRIWDGINAQLAQQFFHRGQYAGRQLTSFNVTGDYNLTPNTQLRGRYTVFTGNEDLQMQGSIGIKQEIPITKNLKADLAYERVFGDLLGKNGNGDVFAQPFAYGQSASTLGLTSGDSYSIGLNYLDQNLQGRIRYELRNGNGNGDNRVLTAAIAGKIGDSLTGLANYQQSNLANQGAGGLLGDTVKFRSGLAYRNPNSDKFNALLRYEYRRNPSTTPETVLFGSGTGSHEHLFGAEAIYAPSAKVEVFGKVGVRNSVSYLAEDLIGKSTVVLAQGRVTYRFTDRWDVAGEARWLGQGGYSETGLLGEVGYYISPTLRLAGGYSFGKAGDRDFDGTRTVGGPYLGVQLKLDQLFNGFGLQKWPKALADSPAEPEAKPVTQPPVEPTPIVEPPRIEPIPVEPAPIQIKPVAPPRIKPAPAAEVKPTVIRALW